MGLRDTVLLITHLYRHPLRQVLYSSSTITCVIHDNHRYTMITKGLVMSNLLTCFVSGTGTSNDDKLNIGLLPTSNDKDGRSANFIALPGHNLWKALKNKEKAAEFFKKSFPLFKLEDYVEQEVSEYHSVYYQHLIDCSRNGTDSLRQNLEGFLGHELVMVFLKSFRGRRILLKVLKVMVHL